jgi:hypothetical protein
MESEGALPCLQDSTTGPHPETEANYEGESNENRKKFFKFNLLNESGTQLYHFST